MIAEYDEAIWLEPRFAMTYSNRGLTCGEIGQYLRTVEHYNEATSLNLQLTGDYAGWAIAYTLLGMGVEVQRDVDQAIGLGMGIVALNGLIEKLKAERWNY